jgi:uracil phosphoribosyltransferase
LSPINLESAKQLCIEAMSSAIEHNSHKYLLDHRDVETTMPVLDLEKVPRIMKEVGVDPEGKMVVLVDPSSPNNNLFTFVKNVLNLASVQIKIFYDKDEALTWLRLQT